MGVEFRQGWDLGRVRFWVGRDLGGAMLKHGTGPLLRTCVEERQHMERRASGVWNSRVWR